MQRWAFGIVLSALLVYVALCVGAHLLYRRFVYPAPPPRADAILGHGERLEFAASDGVLAHALWFAPPADGRLVVYFHGNGGLAEDEVPLGTELGRRGFGALVVEYRGYGMSAANRSSEQGLYADAEGALNEAARRGYGADRVALWGTSLGTGVAAEMARRGRGSALVLVSPFTSLTDVASRAAWWLPVSLLLPDKFETLIKARDIHVPTLVVHGSRDEVVPFAMGQAVARGIEAARFVAVPAASHGDIYDVGGEALMNDIAAHCRGR